MKKSSLLLLSAGATLVLSFVVVIGLYSIPKFSNFFDSFEADVPLVTKIILSTYKMWWIFPLITLLAGIEVFRRKSLSTMHSVMAGRLFIGSIIFATILYILMHYGMYSPIYEMRK